MVRARKRAQPSTQPRPRSADDLDVNAVVSYNVKAIRERQGWTQQSVAERLSRLTGHQLPQASISAMERGFDGDRRRRFDAHELYLLSEVFGVPIVYFFIPPPGSGFGLLADTRRPVTDLYKNLLGHEWQLKPMDERLAKIHIENPEETDAAVAAIFGAEVGTRNWHTSFRTWRKDRLREMEKEYGDRLDEVAAFLKDFATKIETLGPGGFLQSTAHREGDSLHGDPMAQSLEELRSQLPKPVEE